MNTTMRHDDPKLDAAIRAALGDIIASCETVRAVSVESSTGGSDVRSGRRLISVTAISVLVVVGLGLIAGRSGDGAAPADQVDESTTNSTDTPKRSRVTDIDGGYCACRTNGYRRTRVPSSCNTITMGEHN